MGVTPVTCAFTSCMWKFTGLKKGDCKKMSSSWKEAADGYDRFSESKSA